MINNHPSNSFSFQHSVWTRQGQEHVLKNLYWTLLKIFYRHDPICCIAHDSGDIEEYSGEAQMVLVNLPDARSEADVRQILHETITYWFSSSDADSVSVYHEMAQEIWGAWEQTMRIGRQL